MILLYQAIFIDIDGTLRTDTRGITKRTREAIQKVIDLGILVVICSGRPRKSAIQVSKEVGASHYIISSNGALRL